MEAYFVQDSKCNLIDTSCNFDEYCCKLYFLPQWLQVEIMNKADGKVKTRIDNTNESFNKKYPGYRVVKCRVEVIE